MKSENREHRGFEYDMQLYRRCQPERRCIVRLTAHTTPGFVARIIFDVHLLKHIPLDKTLGPEPGKPN